MAAEPVPFEINPNAGTPIYRQLVDQVHALVAGGKLREGDMLPSVRRVAGAAAVNPMTVSKAYSLLEAEGTLIRVRGQGMRVGPAVAQGTLKQRRERLRETLAPAVHRARQLGLSDDQVRALLNSLLKEHRP